MSGNAALLAITGLVVAAGYVAGSLTGQDDLMRDILFWPTLRYALFFLWLPLPFAFLVGRLRVRDGGGRYIQGWKGWKAAVRRFGDRYANVPALLRAATAGLAMAVIINVYGSWKRAMPSVQPFAWDERFADLDRWVHLGTDPWRLLQPWLGRAEITYALDSVYYTWLPLFMAMLGWQAWSTQGDLRRRFFLGVVFVWIGLGSVAATLFSSAGPCFYGFLVPGADPFAPLFDYLRQAGGGEQLLSLRGQEVLWSAYRTGQANPFSGISAMPSVHMGMATLYAVMGWERARWLGIMFGGYALLILVGTVHLGWHYAIDGYVSMLAVLLVWPVLRPLGNRLGALESHMSPAFGSRT